MIPTINMNDIIDDVIDADDTERRTIKKRVIVTDIIRDADRVSIQSRRTNIVYLPVRYCSIFVWLKNMVWLYMGRAGHIGLLMLMTLYVTCAFICSCMALFLCFDMPQEIIVRLQNEHEYDFLLVHCIFQLCSWFMVVAQLIRATLTTYYDDTDTNYTFSPTPVENITFNISLLIALITIIMVYIRTEAYWRYPDAQRIFVLTNIVSPSMFAVLITYIWLPICNY